MSDRMSPACEVKRKTDCPNCGANLKNGATTCSFCGSHIRDSLSDDAFRETCQVFIKALNKTLRNVFTARMTFIFAVGVVGIPLAVFFILQWSGWGVWARLSVATLLAVTGLVIAGVTLSADQKRVFHKQLKPRIDVFLRENSLTPMEFLSIARSQVKESDPLFEYLDEIVA